LAHRTRHSTCARQVSRKTDNFVSCVKNTIKSIVKSFFSPKLFLLNTCTKNIGFSWNNFVSTWNVEIYARNVLSSFKKN
jgi:hypothetical protein